MRESTKKGRRFVLELVAKSIPDFGARLLASSIRWPAPAFMLNNKNEPLLELIRRRFLKKCITQPPVPVGSFFQNKDRGIGFSKLPDDG